MDNDMTPLRNEFGFTLIEVLIAVVILSFGLIGVAGMQVVAIQVNSSANRLTRATTLVQDKVEELLALPFTDTNLDDATVVGVCEPHTETNPPQGYTLIWCVDANAAGTSKTVDVIANWNQSGEWKSFSLSVVKTVFQ
jgi:type IV pilus assembly protein PilV